MSTHSSHFLFVDDTLIFCGADPDHLHYMRCLFICFEVVLGLKINLAKLELVPMGNVDNVDGLASILGCGVSSSPLKYFDLPLGAFFCLVDDPRKDPSHGQSKEVACHCGR
jgi:hypothetical protein